MNKSTDSRRSFIKKSAVGAIGLSIPFTASSYSNIIGANDRVNLAVMGLNGRGQAHIRAGIVTENAQVTGICDVDAQVLAKVSKLTKEWKGGSPKVFTDFRNILTNPDVDAVTIAAPDHWHTPMAMMSMKAGKHVYLEKPCNLTPEEGEWLIESQKKYGKVLQIGNQQRSAPTSIMAMKDIQDGIIGEVYMGKAWYSNTRGSIGVGKMAEAPEGLDWDLWQGPAPRKGYKDNIVHYNWHWFWHWGSGEINNNGFHEIDICRWALGVDFPTKVTSSGGRYHFKDDWEFYDTQVASFEFEGDKMISWEGRSCNGFNYHDRGRGATIHGTEGTILLDRNGYYAYDNKSKSIKEEKEQGRSGTTDTVGIGALDLIHMENFVAGIQNGAQLNSPVEEGVKSNLLCHLGNIAQKYERTVHTDPKSGIIENDEEATSMWSREYETNWRPEV